MLEKDEGFMTLRGCNIDVKNYPKLFKYKWQLQKNGNTTYAFFWKGHRRIYMHWLTIKEKRPSSAHEVDHIDGNGLNNAEYNLRWVTHTENMQNQHLKEQRLTNDEHDAARFVQTMRYGKLSEEEIFRMVCEFWQERGEAGKIFPLTQSPNILREI